MESWKTLSSLEQLKIPLKVKQNLPTRKAPARRPQGKLCLKPNDSPRPCQTPQREGWSPQPLGPHDLDAKTCQAPGRGRRQLGFSHPGTRKPCLAVVSKLDTENRGPRVQQLTLPALWAQKRRCFKTWRPFTTRSPVGHRPAEGGWKPPAARRPRQCARVPLGRKETTVWASSVPTQNGREPCLQDGEEQRPGCSPWSSPGIPNTVSSETVR